jgi:formylglycine-generating enzyme required for sulfatase activity
MGAPANELCRDVSETQHPVTLTRSYELPPRETTQTEYATLMGFNPSARPQCGANCPVENVNWHLAVAYCNALSRQEGKAECYGCDGGTALPDGGFTLAQCDVLPAYSTNSLTLYHCPGYRLPHDAEWENAYRAGTTTPLYNGTYAPSADGGCPTVGVEPTADAIAWYTRNSGSATHEVALKAPNNWGLYDMGGNVAELTHDLYISDLTSAAVTDPTGGTTGTQSVLRGGHWASGIDEVRAAQRKPQTRTGRGTGVGFRCARSL